MKLVHRTSVPLKFLMLLLIVFVAKGVVSTFAFPAFSGHDEVAHYAYLKILAEEGRVPLIPDPVAWEEDYRENGSNASWDRMPADLYRYAHQDGKRDAYTTQDWYGGESAPVWTVQYDGHFYPSGWVYTGNHPPLFYAMLTPVYHLVKNLDMDQQLYLFRLATIPFGMATVVFAYLTVRALFPRDYFLAMTVPAFVAFQPQISYESTMLNNDILAIALTSGVVWLLTLGLRKRFPWWVCMLIGMFYGFALLAKSTSLIVGGLIAFAMAFGIGIRRVKTWLPKGIVTAAIGFALAAPWYLYMWVEYGDLTALNRVNSLQWWNRAQQLPTIQEMLVNKWFHWDRWKETWGAFGWRRIQLDMYGDSTLLRVLLWIAIIGVLGLAVYALRFLREQREITVLEEHGVPIAEIRSHRDETLAILPWQVTGILTLGAACVGGYYAVLQFGTSFVLTQARYYFPMIVPGAILMMLGIRSWFPRRWLPTVGAGVFLGLVVLNIVIYAAYVIPFWPGFIDVPPLP